MVERLVCSSLSDSCFPSTPCIAHLAQHIPASSGPQMHPLLVFSEHTWMLWSCWSFKTLAHHRSLLSWRVVFLVTIGIAQLSLESGIQFLSLCLESSVGYSLVHRSLFSPMAVRPLETIFGQVGCFSSNLKFVPSPALFSYVMLEFSFAHRQ